MHSHTPLWNNSFMPELSTIPDPGVWASYGILFLSQVMSGTGHKSYNRLREEFSLPHQLHYRYLQLRHALRAQMGPDSVEVSSPQVLDVIFGKDSAKLTSNCYYVIRRRRTSKIMQVAKWKWERDLGPIEDTEWEEILEGVKTVSPKISDRLTQLYIVHQAYITPQRLAKFQTTRSTACPRCAVEEGSFLHLLWHCSDIQAYWLQVTVSSR